MIKPFIFSRIGVALLGFTFYAAPALGAKEAAVPAPTERPSAVTELDGRLDSVDLTNQRLNVKDAKDRVVTLQITKQSVISNAGSSKLTLKDLKVNDRIYAYYTTADKKAIQIDVSPALPVMRDLETR